MNQQPKSKVLIILIGILLIANLVMLSIFFINKPGTVKKDRLDKKAFIGSYLKTEIGFTDQQLARYDSLSDTHRTEVRLKMNELSAERKNIFESLALTSFSDSSIDKAASLISEQQKIFEVKMLKHIREIRGICNQSQLPRFDTSFHKIIWKRGEEHKKNKK